MTDRFLKRIPEKFQSPRGMAILIGCLVLLVVLLVVSFEFIIGLVILGVAALFIMAIIAGGIIMAKAITEYFKK